MPKPDRRNLADRRISSSKTDIPEFRLTRQGGSENLKSVSDFSPSFVFRPFASPFRSSRPLAMDHAPGHPHSPISAGLSPAGFDDLFLGRDYDANGNRDSTGYTVGTGDTLTASPNATYTYDAAGHLTSRTDTSTGKVTTFAYDHRDRLTGITRKTSGGTVDYRTTYVYDALNRRIAEQVDADGAGAGSPVTTWTVFDGENPYADFNGAGSLQTRYLYSLAVDEILGRTDSSGDTYWYMTDGLGSVRDIFDEWGSSAYHTGYDSFGSKISTTGTGDRFGFTGREHDAALNLYYYRARFYDPATGRFLSKDPIGFEAGDTNLYRYVGNGPQNAVDPSGKLTSDTDQQEQMISQDFPVTKPIDTKTIRSKSDDLNTGRRSGFMPGPPPINLTPPSFVVPVIPGYMPVPRNSRPKRPPIYPINDQPPTIIIDLLPDIPPIIISQPKTNPLDDPELKPLYDYIKSLTRPKHALLD